MPSRQRQQQKMTPELSLQLYSEMLKTGLLVCAPLLGITLVVGLVVSILQIVTQIQDATLSFIPKLVAFVVAAIVLAPWMLHQLQVFAETVLLRAATLR